MESIDRLRKYVGANTEKTFALTAYPKQYAVNCTTVINDLIDAIEREVEECYAELPKDADGEYIHIGDELDRGKVFRIEIADGDHKAYVQTSQSNPQLEWYYCKYIHHKPPTVEDVLRKFGRGWHEQMNVPETFDIADYVERYAAKLQLREEDE